jgi:hypothetical protein
MFGGGAGSSDMRGVRRFYFAGLSPMFHVEHRAEFDCATQRAVDRSEFYRPCRYASGCSRGRLALVTKIPAPTRFEGSNPGLIPESGPDSGTDSDPARAL